MILAGSRMVCRRLTSIRKGALILSPREKWVAGLRGVETSELSLYNFNTVSLLQGPDVPFYPAVGQGVFLEACLSLVSWALRTRGVEVRGGRTTGEMGRVSCCVRSVGLLSPALPPFPVRSGSGGRSKTACVGSLCHLCVLYTRTCSSHAILGVRQLQTSVFNSKWAWSEQQGLYRAGERDLAETAPTQRGELKQWTHVGAQQCSERGVSLKTNDRNCTLFTHQVGI